MKKGIFNAWNSYKIPPATYAICHEHPPQSPEKRSSQKKGTWLSASVFNKSKIYLTITNKKDTVQNRLLQLLYNCWIGIAHRMVWAKKAFNVKKERRNMVSRIKNVKYTGKTKTTLYQQTKEVTYWKTCKMKLILNRLMKYW